MDFKGVIMKKTIRGYSDFFQDEESEGYIDSGLFFKKPLSRLDVQCFALQHKKEKQCKKLERKYTRDRESIRQSKHERGLDCHDPFGSDASQCDCIDKCEA